MFCVIDEKLIAVNDWSRRDIRKLTREFYNDPLTLKANGPYDKI
jgi:hypothetical protein